MKVFKDQLGVLHSFESSPRRIVSLVPSQTELLYDLGLEKEIIGITKFCVHPFHLKSSKAIIGGTKNIKFDTIKSLLPDIIIANKEENTFEMVEELRIICPVWVTDIINIDDNLKMIADFGELFDKRTEAEVWINKINFAYKNFKISIKNKTIQNVAYFIWANPYMVTGNKTFINEMLQLNKFKNIYENREERYPEINIQKMSIQGIPELILLSSEPFPFKNEHASEIAKYTNHDKIVFVDGEMFSWYGSRLLKAFEYFKKLQDSIH